MNEFVCHFMSKVSKLYRYHELMDSFHHSVPHGIIAQIEYVRPIVHNIMPLLPECFEPANEKDYEEWTVYLEGVIRLYNGNYHFATLNRINRILCYLPKGHRMKSWCYLQRCKVLVKMDRYEECRQNLKYIRYCDLQTSDDRIGVQLIQLRCIQRGYSSVKSDVKDFRPDMTLRPHPRIKYAAECLQISEYDSHLGLATRRKLDPYELLAIEEPYCFLLHPTAVFGHCTFCRRENYFDMIPCGGCRHAMFCNEDCMKAAMDSFHRYDCIIWPMLYRVFGKVSVGLRILFQSIPLFDSFEDFMEFCQDPDNFDHNCYTIDHDGPEADIEQFKSVLGLVYNKNKQEKIDPFYHSVMTLVVHKYVTLLTPLGKIVNSEDKVLFLHQIIYKLLIIGIFHCTVVPLTKIRDFNDEPDAMGVGIYPFSTLIAASGITDNAIRMYYKGKSYLYTIYPLPRYTELYINYDLRNHPLLDSNVAQ